MSGIIFSLRDYQRECLESILERYRAGVRRQLTSLPTGSGKTVIFAEFPRYFSMKKQMLVLAHRRELLDQACDKIRRANPNLCVAVEQAGRSADPDCDVVVASVPTLGRKGSKRLQRLDPDRFFLIVVDEAHHATAATYIRVLEYFGVFSPDTRKLLVGFTATPKRGDGKGLDAVFQEIVFSKGLPEMIQAGYLAPMAGYRIETDIDLSRVKTRMGDFVVSHLSRAVNVEARNDLVVKVFRSHLESRQTICFCVDVAHARSVAAAFNAQGIAAAAVSGDMERRERKKYHPDIEVEKYSIQDDHLHIVIIIPPKYSVSSIIGKIKANTSREIRQHFKWIRKMYERNEFWSPGFFSSTVGIDEDVIKKYVEFQEKMDKGQLQLSFDFKF
ncbi:MAG: IS200/IS605 family transposase [Candidatus Desulfatibia sp.]|uniref:IS200/IS605 family transposase n=1 Tax=Candidatus Desulfatibia sp. TaxID=3101189 RepID=UPI002F345155